MTTYLKNGFHQELCRFRTATYPNTGLPQEVFLKDFDDRFLVKKNLISSCTNEKYLEALFWNFCLLHIYIYIYIYIIHQSVIFVLQFPYTKRQKSYNFKFSVTPPFTFHVNVYIYMKFVQDISVLLIYLFILFSLLLISIFLLFLLPFDSSFEYMEIYNSFYFILLF